MSARQPAKLASRPLLDLLEQRFSLQLDIRSPDHLRDVIEHYDAKRKFLLYQHGESGALANPDYAKSVLISEAARMTLREIDPWPRRKKPHRGK
jgi:hypothetical protein